MTGTSTAAPVRNEAWPAIRGLDDLTRMVDGLPRGVALLTPELRVLHVNPAGRAIEGAGREALAGPAAPLHTTGITVPGRGTHPLAGGGRREVEYFDVPLELQGQHLLVRAFRDVTEERRAMRRQGTLTHVAARVALAESLEATLDTVAECLLESTEMSGCAAIVFDGEPARFRVAGTAGLPADYAERFRRALRWGNELLPALSAFRSQRTVIVDRTRDEPAVAYPERLSRSLIFVKWLLAIPHFLVLAIFVGGGLWLGTRSGGTDDAWDNGSNAGWSLFVLLVLIAAIVLLFTGRYPRPLYDFVLGMDRWALRVGPTRR
jgi:hypothetical protein